VPDNPLLNPRAAPEMARANIQLKNLGETDRVRRLSRLWAYYVGCQHLHNSYDWDGREVLGDDPDWVTAATSSNKFVGKDDVDPGFFIPMRHRRPCATFPMAPVVVNGFTAFLFGEGRWPEIRVDGDADTQDYVRAIVDAAKIREAMLLARSMGGAMGTACISYTLVTGTPRTEVHDAKNIQVLAWADRGFLIPAHVVEIYKFQKQEELDGKLARVWYWHKREWTASADIVYNDAPVGKGDDPVFTVASAVQHDLGFCPFVWVQNLPSGDGEDGLSDYDGLPDLFDQIDRLLSAVSKGTILNVDPTLLLKMRKEDLRGAQIRKGTDNAIVTGTDGSASYLELSGSSVAAGLAMLKQLVQHACERAKFVLIDPEKISGAAQSGKAIEYLYAPMIAQTDVLRLTWGEALKRLLEGMWKMCVAYHGRPATVMDPETGEAWESKTTVILPPRVVRGTDGSTTLVERAPGAGGNNIRLVWPPYFQPTISDIDTAIRVASTSVGGAQLFSERSMRAWAARYVGVQDIDEEERIIAQEREAMPGVPPADSAGGPLSPEQMKALMALALGNGAEQEPAQEPTPPES